MKAHALVPDQVGAERLVGWVACHDVRDAGGSVVVRKGTRLDRDLAERLAGSGAGEVHLIEMEPCDLHEDAAGDRLARAVAGRGVRIRDSAGGQWALVSSTRGILHVTVETLAAVNALDGVSVYTLYDGQVVPAHLMEVSLSCDHRILYGSGAAGFLGGIKSNLENPEVIA